MRKILLVFALFLLFTLTSCDVNVFKQNVQLDPEVHESLKERGTVPRSTGSEIVPYIEEYSCEKSGHGHRLKRTCIDCGYRPTVGYYYPNGHANGKDENCDYCMMTLTTALFSTTN